MARRSSKPPAGSAYDAGLRLISLRDHSAAELRRKLKRRGYDDNAIESTRERLGERGYLNDQVFARLYAQRRARTHGRLAISAELAARGVDRETIEDALARLAPQSELQAVRRVAGRIAGRTTYASYQELLGSVGVKLLRRGFPMNLARQACADLWPGTPDTSEP